MGMDSKNKRRSAVSKLQERVLEQGEEMNNFDKVCPTGRIADVTHPYAPEELESADDEQYCDFCGDAAEDCQCDRGIAFRSIGADDPGVDR